VRSSMRGKKKGGLSVCAHIAVPDSSRREGLGPQKKKGKICGIAAGWVWGKDLYDGSFISRMGTLKGKEDC